MISGKAYIKKSGWRKISFYFNVSYEIRDKNIEFDENRNVQRAEFIVRAIMQGGRFADGWGSCERREKKFLKPNHDIPSTAETRAKNRACQESVNIEKAQLGFHDDQTSSTVFPDFITTKLNNQIKIDKVCLFIDFHGLNLDPT
ncbi:hypothetical protein F2Q69_00032112 [Brassica cretica]|uniref:Uncharacterized protein n=1 Tax=Brassica cretica TaxID=69181 RepID=A0A8S9S185_BRACR|nr:hypothetical protein F2Q69_00032112 [Brassica cretica]